ncbi:ADP-ribosylglycohydrolase family protein [Aquibacillus saliphilus]|uniref:ADP-ribosylglycohydrolase family protein n=1 Tax=Aquibacillus saliphilus TaxID=1909422 RepID=UPI001CEFB347|nr:ADP-ribosylglycohydrolase family protein [Aquibacillus saliphilus]
MDDIMGGVIGLAVADALGVPVEFVDRQTLKSNPVIDMRSHGTYNQPAGTWSDDTSMTLCLVESLSEGLDYTDIMNNFNNWFEQGEYSPHGEVFDIGIATRKALKRFSDGTAPLNCGGMSEFDNGNGSLMRILPAAFYLQFIDRDEKKNDEKAFTIIHNISALTHAHKRSQLACGVYVSIARSIIGSSDLEEAVNHGIDKAIDYYKHQPDYIDELHHFQKLSTKEIGSLLEKQIKSSGYVVDTLEAAIWCLLTTGSYQDCVLKAVNLGEDTDTVAAVAGGLAGLHYGYQSIPKEWVATLVRRDYIEGLCNKLGLSFYKLDIENLISYIPYFEFATRESVCQWKGGEKLGEKHFSMPYPEYDQTFKEFIQQINETNLLLHQYTLVTDKLEFANKEQVNSTIATADFDLLRAILTRYVRQERFSDGAWASAVEDKVFFKILQRLQQVKSLG